MNVKATSILGQGIYSYAEAARYAGLHVGRVSAWFKQNSKSGDADLLHSEFAVIGLPGALSFLNLIEIFVVGQFREKGVSLQEIRKAHTLLKIDLETEHPFSHKDLYAHSRKVFVKVANDEDNTALYQVVSRQGFDEEVMKEYLQQIEYSDLTKLAERWRLSKGVVIDPRICLGKPVIEGRGISTHAIAAGYWANNKDAKFVADLYSISEKDVDHAVLFQISHGNGKAA